MTYLLTSWRGMSEKAAQLSVETVDLPSLAKGIQDIALDAIGRDQAPMISFGTYYVGAHNEAGFQDTNLVALEFSEDQRDDLRWKLRRLGWRAILLDTYCVDDDALCVTAVIPLDRKLTTKKQYYRAASLLTYDIGLGQMSDCWSCTFIGIVNPDGENEDLQGEVLEIDHRFEEGGYGKNINYLRGTLCRK